MIITQTPLRISLLGGGTDFPAFFRQHGGAVLSLGIDKYVYVIIKERFDELIYINYSKKEIVSSIDEIRHDLVREAMRLSGVEQGVEITTLADVPSEGSGLGSSSSVTVGLLNALHNYAGNQVSAAQLADEAVRIEMEILGRPVGVQDQYIAACGNLRFMEFGRDGTIHVEPVRLTEAEKRRLVSNLLLFYTGRTRNAATILKEQEMNIPARNRQLVAVRDLAYRAKEAVESGDLDSLGQMLNENWMIKKSLAGGITLPEIDRMYEVALAAGALGGKISGAGGGGFLLLYCPRYAQDQVRKALSDFRELPFMLSRYGSKVIFHMTNHEWK